MKQTLLVISALMLLQPTVSTAQETSRQDLLEWNEFYSLTWEDFQGNRTAGYEGDAGTVVQIKAKPFKVGNKINYDVLVFFNRAKSWAADKSDELLDHERLHFDIAELYARKIRKRIDELEQKGVNELSVYNKAVKQLLEESNDEDRRYDIETLHGAMVKKQKQWHDDVQRELSLLERYKKQKKVITAG